MSKVSKPPRPSLADRRREAILDGASQLFARRGYSETDTQVLADALGVGKGTLYRYFKSKKAIFLACVDRLMLRLRAHVEACRERETEPLKRVRGAIRAFLEFCIDHPEFAELLVQERAQFKDRAKPTYLVHRESYIGYWEQLYQLLIDEGRIREMPVDRITNTVHCLLYGSLFTGYYSRSSRSLDEQVEDVVDILFHGILSLTEQRRRGKD